MISAEGQVLDFRRMLDALADPVVAADSTNTIVYVNQAACSLLGWTQEELVGQPLLAIIPPRFQEAHVNGFRRYLATHVPHIIGHPIRVPALRRDGSEVDIELTLSALTMGSGAPMFVGSLRDLRERVELERQLLVTRYLRAVNKAAAQLPSLLDLDSVLDIVVRTLVDDFGASLARVWIYDATHNRLDLRASAGLANTTTESSRAHIDVASYPYKVGRVARTRKPFVKNGLTGDPEFDQDWVIRERIAAVAAFPLLIGEELHGVLVHFADHSLPDELVEALTTFVGIVDTALSDIRRFSREEAARADAEEAERRFAFLAEASKALSASLDYGETLATVGRLAVTEMADWCVVHVLQEDGGIGQLIAAHADPNKEQILRDAQFRFPIDPQSSGGVPHVLRTGEPTLVPEITDEMIAAGISDHDLLAVLLDLGLRSLMTVPMAVFGRVLGAITFVSARADRRYSSDDLALAQDLAARAALAVDNARLYRDVQEAVRTRDQFLSSVSHDLKNPLTSIRGRAQIIQRRARRMHSPEGDQIAAALDEVVASAGTMNTLINDLVDVARLRVGQPLTLRRAPADLVALARQAAEEQNQISPRHTIRVQSVSPDLVGTWDAARLERVLANLLSNAVKYSPSGGEIDVVVGAEETASGPCAVVTVRDCGIGIPEAEISHVFEQYYRASNVVGKIAGTGIGLAGVRQIVEQHAGSIDLESEEGKGTTITVRLPLQEVEEPASL